MERYARASGHPRLLELLSRHAIDQKDKFTLSDDDQVRSIFRPHKAHRARGGAMFSKVCIRE